MEHGQLLRTLIQRLQKDDELNIYITSENEVLTLEGMLPDQVEKYRIYRIDD